jgi:LysM repeat protein
MAGGGPERFILTIALLVPLGIGGISALQLATVFSVGSGRVLGPSDTMSLARRPISLQATPPPTVAAPTPTPVPSTVSPAPAGRGTATPAGKRTYVVQPGDELRHIAAWYGVSISTIINANDVPNPDSLRVGQVLTIPET